MDEGRLAALGLIVAAQYIVQDALEVANSANLGREPYDALHEAMGALDVAEFALREHSEDEDE